MAFNVFVFKKWGALFLVSALSVVSFFLGLTMANLLYAILFWLLGALIAMIIAILLIKNPFSDLIEGKGMLIEDENSTGVIRWYICKVIPPNIHTKIGGQEVTETFDRNAVYQLATPVQHKKPWFSRDKEEKLFVQQITDTNATPQEVKEGKVGGLRISLSEDMYNKGRFALFHYPLLKYNSMIGGIVTKDFISEKEKEAFAEHGILNLNRRAESLDQSIRNYARYVVDTVLKPKPGFLSGNWWIWLIIIGLIGLVLMVFWPNITQAFGGMMPKAATSITPSQIVGS